MIMSKILHAIAETTFELFFRGAKYNHHHLVAWLPQIE